MNLINNQYRFTKKLFYGIVVLVVVFISSCENDPEEIANYTKDVIEVETGYDIQGVFSQSANLKAVLTAPEMRRVRADTPYTEFPVHIHVDFYNENAELESVLNAKYAKYYETMAKVYLQDSVQVYNMKGDTLRCKNLWWEQAKEEFYTNDSVHLITPMQNLKGAGMRAKADFSSYTMLDAKGPVAIPDSLNAGF